MRLDQVTKDLRELILAKIKPVVDRRETETLPGHSLDIDRESLVQRISGISRPVVRAEVDKIMSVLGYWRGCTAGNTLDRYYYWKNKT